MDQKASFLKKVKPVHHIDHKKIEASKTTTTPDYQKTILENSKAVEDKMDVLTNCDMLAPQQDRLNEETGDVIQHTFQTRPVTTAPSSSDDSDKYFWNSSWDASIVSSCDSQSHTNDDTFQVSFKQSLPYASTDDCNDGKNSQHSHNLCESLQTYYSDDSSWKPEVPFEIEILNGDHTY